jgi:Tfp pilus assembly protein PilF
MPICMRRVGAQRAVPLLALLVLALCPAVWAGEPTPSPLEVSKRSPARRHTVLGVEHFHKGRMDVASRHFRVAVQADGTSAEAHYNLALALDAAGDHFAAAREFERALALAPDDPAIARSDILLRHVNRNKKELMRKH